MTSPRPPRNRKTSAARRARSVAATQAAATQHDSKATPVFQALAQIPAGRVATYGQIAKLAGLPGAARYVGYCLRNLPDGSTLPWHRVVAAGGRIAFAAGSDAFVRQIGKLQREGITSSNGRIDLRRFQWEAGITHD